MAGTIGHKLMSGKSTTIDLDKDTRIDVRCQVYIHLLPPSYDLHHPRTLMSSYDLFLALSLSVL